ncbi:MAG: alkaline phosphatase [Candidatus Margulisbacteria bacterium]|nr:alkaline phosphatase [Candidatus Margulisiibacteriota bacterium]
MKKLKKPTKRKRIKKKSPISFWGILFILIVVTCISVTLLFFHTAPFPMTDSKPKNLILMIPDGLGPDGVGLARSFKGKPLHLDQYLVGMVQTNATNVKVTDSSAAATAYATGKKVVYNTISIDNKGQALPTIMEAAKRQGKGTGIVVTSRITHATPACFYAHTSNRHEELRIAKYLIHSKLDIALGGGLSWFLPYSEGGKQRPGHNLLNKAKEKGYRVITTLKQLRKSLPQNPILGLFSRDHMPYELERNPDLKPSLSEMTKIALNHLKKKPEGFFLMVEGSLIDQAAHASDAALFVNEAIEFDNTVALCMKFAQNNPGTLVVIVPDHETGGLAVGEGDLNLLKNSKLSSEAIWNNYQNGQPFEEALLQGTGITELTVSENYYLFLDQRVMLPPHIRLARIISWRSNILWATIDHSLVDVPIYAYGPGSKEFRGVIDNSDVGNKIISLFDLDMSFKPSKP